MAAVFSSGVTYRNLVGTFTPSDNTGVYNNDGIIMNYLNRNDFPTWQMMPIFIRNSEQKLSRDLKHILNTYNVATPFTPNNSIYPKPDLWRRTISLFYINPDTNQVTNMEYRTLEYINNYNPTLTSGYPLFYGDNDRSNFIISPPPAFTNPPQNNNSLQVIFYGIPAPLSNNNQTNQYTEFAPDALIYAILVEAAIFIRTPEQLQIYQAQYEKAIDKLNEEDQIRYYDRAVKREVD